MDIKLMIAALSIMLIQACAWQVDKNQFNPRFDRHSLTAVTEQDIQRQLLEDIGRFQSLVEKVLIQREKMLAGYQQIKTKLNANKPLSGADIEFLNDGSIKHLKLRRELYQFAYAYERWVSKESPDISSALRLQGVMLSLTASLILYDNYLIAISVFEENGKLRRYLNDRHQGYEIGRRRLTAITLRYNSLNYRHRIRKAINYFETHWPQQSQAFQHSPVNAYLYSLINQSPSYNATIKFSPLFVLQRYIKFLAGITADSLKSLKDNGINLLSFMFGNTTGLIETRKGRMYDRPEIEQYLATHLMAGDILLEKTPFRLTDKLIPGYWGHAAIWVGTEQELKALGVWYDPVVRPFHEAISQGRLVAEALRPGVELNTLSEFLNIDDLAVLRSKTISRQERANVILRTLRQIGKPYDFNFDIETNDRIICSELIYIAYAGIDWPTQNMLGLYTVSPEHIVEKAGDGGLFEVAEMFVNGAFVKTEPDKVIKDLK